MKVTEKVPGELWLHRILGSGAAVGGLATGYILLNGHRHEFMAAWEPPWGGLVATYEFLLLLSAGLCLLAGVGRLVGGAEANPLEGRAIRASLVALTVALAAVLPEITHPPRLALDLPFDTSFFVLLALTAGLFLLYLAVLGGMAAGVRRSGRLIGILGVLGFLIAYAAVRCVGMLLGRLEAEAAWQQGYFPAYFVVSSLLLAFALMALTDRYALVVGVAGSPEPFNLRTQRRHLLVGIALLAICMVAYDAWAYFFQPQGVELLVRGALGVNFWSLEIVLGSLVPPLLLLSQWGLQPWGVALAGGLVLAGHYFRHFDRVVSSQLGSVLARFGEVDHDLLSFAPCPPKALAIIGYLSLFFLLVLLWERRILHREFL